MHNQRARARARGIVNKTGQELIDRETKYMSVWIEGIVPCLYSRRLHQSSRLPWPKQLLLPEAYSGQGLGRW